MNTFAKVPLRVPTGEETITSDLTYDLRSGDPDFVDKLVGLTFGNMAYDAMLDGKTGVMSALVKGCTSWCPSLIPSSGRASWTSPPCTTRSDTVPCTLTSRDCQSFCSARRRPVGMRKYTASLTISAGFALLPMVVCQKNCLGAAHADVMLRGTL